MEPLQLKKYSLDIDERKFSIETELHQKDKESNSRDSTSFIVDGTILWDNQITDATSC